MQDIFIYHAGCPDGLAAAFIARLSYPDGEFIPCQYGKAQEELYNNLMGRCLTKSDRLFFLDFSLPEDMMEVIEQTEVGHIVVLDHHESAEWIRTRSYGKYYDPAHSGAFITWCYFHQTTPPPRWVLYVEDRDLWRWNMPGSRAFSAALRSYPFELDHWLKMFGSTPASWDAFTIKLLDEGEALLRNMESQVSSLVRKTMLVSFDPPHQVFFHKAEEEASDVIPAVNTSLCISEVCERLLELYPKAQVAAAYFDVPEGKVWSLRSRPGSDAAMKLAVAFGGGGHPAAAGFTQKILRLSGRTITVDTQPDVGSDD